jgi:hypothetical protein
MIPAVLAGLADCSVLVLILIPVTRQGFVVHQLHHRRHHRLPRTEAVAQPACFAAAAFAVVIMERFACLETAFQDEERVKVTLRGELA